MADPRIYKLPDGNHGFFFEKLILNERKSNEAGRPIYESQPWVHILAAGDTRRTEPEFPMNEERQDRYSEPFKAWLANKEATGAEGTPLEEWPAMPASRAQEFRDQKVYTVDQLATISESRFHAFGPDMRNWVIKAQAFLEAAERNAPVEHLAVENEKLKEQIATLQQQMANLMANMENQPKQGRQGGWPKGKPRKPQEEQSAA